MANKKVPDLIAGVSLHPLAKERTNALLRRLEELGVGGIATVGLSMIDRFRLLASAFYTQLLGTEAPVQFIDTESATVIDEAPPVPNGTDEV